MIDYKYQDLFLEDSVDKQLKISFDGGEITNTDIFSETMQITESICSDSQISFGNCEASIFKITVANINIPLEGKWIYVSMVLNGKEDDPFIFGTYKVSSFKPSADRSKRELIAYDAIKDILDADVTNWYTSLQFPLSLKSFRNSFFAYIGIEQEDASLVNDNMTVEKTIESDEISGKLIINAICEINGCFGSMSRQNKFHYIELALNQFGLYPRNDIYPADDLYPVEPSGRKISNSLWIDCEYEDYLVEKIDKLQVRNEENDVGAIVGTGSNAYVIQDNFLVYGKSSQDLSEIAKNAFSLIKNLSKYRPFKATCLGNPCIEVGDIVRITTKNEIIESYIFQREISGIQMLKDRYAADGSRKRLQNLNSRNKDIKQLKGKTNTLVRNVEETKIELKDLDKNLSAKIQINASAISSEVTRATNAENSLSSRITQTEESISLKVSKNEIVSEINQSAEQIQISASKINLKGAVVANGWVIDANGGGIYNGIPYTGQQNSNSTGMGSYGSDWAFWAGNGKFSVNQSGHVYAQDVKIKGEIEATSGTFSGTVNATNGTFENVTISGSCTVAGEAISGTLSGTTWNGNSIGDAYLSDISGSKVGSGFSAGNMTAGTVCRPYSYGVTAIADAEFNAGVTSRFTSGMFTHSISPQANRSYDIGSSGNRYNGIYASKIYGTVDSSSSRKLKTNIEKFDVEKAMDIINSTEIMSYNYKSDIQDNSERLANKKSELQDYVDMISKLDDDQKPSDANYNQVIEAFNQEIYDIEHEREKSPEKRYGFISEDAPWELVAMNRETVDTYSAVAMCFAAIQTMDKRIKDLESKGV